MDQPILPTSFWQELAHDNPLGRTDITSFDAKCWFNLIWPVYREYYANSHKRPNHKLRIANWWIRIRDSDIDRARERSSTFERSVEVKRITEKARETFNSPPPPNRQDLPPLRVGKGSVSERT